MIRMFAFLLILMSLLSSLVVSPSQAAAEGSGTVYVHLYGCPSNYDTATDHDILNDACDQTPYYNTVNIISEGKTWSGTPSNDFRDWTWTDVPGHIFTIQASVGSYYNQPVVYCTNGGDSGYVQMEASTDWNGAYVHPTMKGGYVTCDWFAKGGATVDTGSISIDAFQCSTDFDAASADINELYVGCEQPQNGVTFEMESYRNNGQQYTTGDNAEGNAYFAYVLEDFVQITGHEVPGFGTPRVFCRSDMVGAGMQEFPAIGWTFAYNLRADEGLKCNWYNVPVAGAVVQINNHLCPNGADLSSADIYTLAATCNLSMNSVQFELDSAGDGRRNFTGDNMGSGIKWFDVVPGDTNIHESAFPGYLAPRVFCSSTLANDANVGETQEIAVVNNAIDYPIQGGATLFCDWFNLPDGGVSQTGSIAVYPSACPEGFELDNSSLQETADQCTTPQDLTLYTLVTLNDTFEHASGWWESGVVVFYGIGANEGLTLVAKPLDGYETGAVYCGQSLQADGQVNGFDRLPTTDTNTIFPTVVPGAQAVCLWYMVSAVDGANGVNNANDTNQDATEDEYSDDEGHGDEQNQGDEQENAGSDELLWTGRVEIEVRACPEGFDPYNGDLGSECWDNANGFDFGIYSADQWWPQTSGDWADQYVIWDPVPVQDVVVQEWLPGGYETPIVFCDGSQMDVSGDGAIDLNVGDGEVIYCTWFNVQQ